MDLGDLTSFVEKPIAAVSNIVNTPTRRDDTGRSICET